MKEERESWSVFGTMTARKVILHKDKYRGKYNDNDNDKCKYKTKYKKKTKTKRSERESWLVFGTMTARKVIQSYVRENHAHRHLRNATSLSSTGH